MDIREQDLTPFVEGQIEINCSSDKCVYRGEIKSIEIKDASLLIIEIAWAGRMDTGTWQNAPYLTSLKVSVIQFEACDVENGRIMLSKRPLHDNKIVFLFPKGDIQIDRSKVQGLAEAA